MFFNQYRHKRRRDGESLRGIKSMGAFKKPGFLKKRAFLMPTKGGTAETCHFRPFIRTKWLIFYMSGGRHEKG
jgi:hypothetical protein